MFEEKISEDFLSTALIYESLEAISIFKTKSYVHTKTS